MSCIRVLCTEEPGGGQRRGAHCGQAAVLGCWRGARQHVSERAGPELPQKRKRAWAYLSYPEAARECGCASLG